MPGIIPHVLPPNWPANIAPSRWAGTVRTNTPEGCAVGLLGLADDLGVRLNGGRPGARDGPRAFREALARYGVAEPHAWQWPVVYDAGDVQPAEGVTEAALFETHRRVSAAAAALLDLGLLPVGIGGGHDLTFAFMRPVVERFSVSTAVYCDAHLDVRPQPGSGMPFRALVEQCGVRRLEAHGLSDFVNSREHVEWFSLHGGIGAGEPRQAVELPREDCVMSIDLDVIDAAFAPGVSAPNPAGWSAREACLYAAAAGRSPRVRAIDIMELNPACDHDQRTARVAARLFLEFLRSLARRGDGP